MDFGKLFAVLEEIRAVYKAIPMHSSMTPGPAYPYSLFLAWYIREQNYRIFRERALLSDGRSLPGIVRLLDHPMADNVESLVQRIRTVPHERPTPDEAAERMRVVHPHS